MSSGEKVVSDVPDVTPCSTAQATAPAYSAPAETSVKLAALAPGLPAAFHIYVTAMLRVQGVFPPKAVPETMPFSYAQTAASA